jgi:rRNA processing protein Krr1/Pno1
LLGKGGKTKNKLARVSGADLELFERDLTLEIKGTDKQRRAARKYAECVMAQRVGPVTLEDDDRDEDRTIVDVPQHAVGFVTGKNGNFLRTIEEEWCVIMFFVEFSNARGKSTERLAIFGTKRGRKGAELKVMSAVECKEPGFYKDFDERTDPGDDFGVETEDFKNGDECSYALGKQGATRKKLEAASQAVLQYIGQTIVYAGTRKQRKACRQYMSWLFKQLDGPVDVDTRDRDDVIVIEVPQDTVGYITGARRAAMIAMEAEWGVFMFFCDFKSRPAAGAQNTESDDRRSRDEGRSKKFEKLLIFGPERSRTGAELKVLSSVETKNTGHVTRQLKEKINEKSGFAKDSFYLKDEDVAYALGKGGTTRMKLQVSSGCILQYIGNYAVLAGTGAQRKRCREFLQWLLAQRRGSITVSDVNRRDDCTEVHIPNNVKGWITGNRGSELRRIEQETDTFLFMALDKGGDERLLILGHDPGDRSSDKGRQRAERLINDLVQERLRNYSEPRGGRGGGGGRRGRDSRSNSRGRRDSRDRGRGRRY